MIKSLTRFLLLTIVAAVAVAGGWWLYQNRAAPAASAAADSFTQVVAVQRGDLSASISVVGSLAAVQHQTLSFERMNGAAPLLTLEVGAGQAVVAGQVLATIDPTPYQQALDQAQSAMQEALQVLEDLQAPISELDLAQADLTVAKARLDLERAREALAEKETPDLTHLETALRSAQDNLQLAQLQRTLAEHDSLAKSERDLAYAVDWHERRVWELKALIASGAASLEQTQELQKQQEALAEAQVELARVQARRQLSLQTAAAEVAAAQAALTEARDSLAEAQAGSNDLALAQARLAVTEAEVSLIAAEQDKADRQAGADAAALAAAQASAEQRRLALAEAGAALAGATLTAPFAGVILQTNVEPGDRINSNTVLLTLANMDELRVLAAIDETTIRQVEAGQQARISFDAFPGQVFSGQVLSVPLQGALQGGVMVYEVTISLQGAEGLPLLVGMTANVSIHVGQVQNALLVPALALQNIGGFYQVLLASDADAQADPVAAPVEVGLSDGVYTQIVRGLNEGDHVLVQLSAAESAGFGLPGSNSGMGGALFGGRGR